MVLVLTLHPLMIYIIKPKFISRTVRTTKHAIVAQQAISDTAIG